MALTAEDQKVRKEIYQRLRDRPLKPEDPDYEELYFPLYETEGCEDPVRLMQDHIMLSGPESLQMFSGFRGSGKTTELFRLRQNLEREGYVVLYGDALEYVSPAEEIEIADLLIVLAGAFSDALERWGKGIKEEVQLAQEGFWTRLKNFLTRTTVSLTEAGVNLEASGPAHEILGGIKGGIDLKLAIKESSTFRRQIQQFLQNRIPQLRAEVQSFFEDGVKAVKRAWGDEKEVVFIFDQLEQLRGSLASEESVLKSVERIFIGHMNLLTLPYVHAVYTVPPWLRFVNANALDLYMLPSIRQWNNDPERSRYEPGWTALRDVVLRRIGPEGCRRFFSCEPTKPFLGADELIALCGGHFRDLLLLLRDTFLRVQSAPVTPLVKTEAINSVRGNFLPISVEDAIWLRKIGESRTTELPNTQPENVNRLTRFIDTHFVLYLTNGKEWYDIHPLIREEVKDISERAVKSPPV